MTLCPGGLHVAIEQLSWQVEHVPGAMTTEVCNLAPTKLVVDLWQVSHAGHDAVGKWGLDLPVAIVPLWQVAQLPAATTTEVCTLAPTKLVVVLWQVSHAGHDVVGT